MEKGKQEVKKSKEKPTNPQEILSSTEEVNLEKLPNRVRVESLRTEELYCLKKFTEEEMAKFQDFGSTNMLPNYILQERLDMHRFFSEKNKIIKQELFNRLEDIYDAEENETEYNGIE